MLRPLKLLFALLVHSFRSRHNLLLENLALRQQLVVLKQKHPQPRLAAPDKLFWVILRRLWPGWKRALILVHPETVVRWHKAGFKLYWTWLSRRRNRVERKCVSKELRELIFPMVAENPTWGAPRIRGELKMLGFEISERTVLRWMRKAPRSPEPAKRWAAFLAYDGGDRNYPAPGTLKRLQLVAYVHTTGFDPLFASIATFDPEGVAGTRSQRRSFALDPHLQQWSLVRRNQSRHRHVFKFARGRIARNNLVAHLHFLNRNVAAIGVDGRASECPILATYLFFVARVGYHEPTLR